MPARIPDDRRRAIADDIRGCVMSQREIAAKHGVAPSTVTAIGKEIDPPADGGEWFDRSGTKKATASLVEDLKAQRARIVALLLRRAEEALQQMDQPYVAYNFGGKDNTYNEKVMDSPPTTARRDLAVISGILLDKAMKAIQFDDNGSHGEQIGLLQQVGRALDAKYGNGDDLVAREGER